MRLIATFESKPEAEKFFSFLLKEGIAVQLEPQKKESKFELWITQEDDCEQAKHWYKKSLEDPSILDNHELPLLVINEQPVPQHSQRRKLVAGLFSIRPPLLAQKKRTPWISYLLVVSMVLLFGSAAYEEAMQARNNHFPHATIYEALYFDFPAPETQLLHLLDQQKADEPLSPKVEAQIKEIQNEARWKGLSYNGQDHEDPMPPFMEKILLQGEIWRLFTPCLLHQTIGHLLINLVLFWLLGTHLEVIIGSGRFLALCLSIGIGANFAQYLISGPFFMGISGVITGIAAFLVARSRKAPWEGYQLERLAKSVLLMALMIFFASISTQLLPWYGNESIKINAVANTAHLSGALIGFCLAQQAYFSRKR